MRLRKRPWSQEMFELHQEILIDSEDDLKGKWKKTLNVDDLKLEIGTGRGDYWHGLAKQYPDSGVIAMEKDFTAASIALKKLTDYGNKRMIYGDAKDLESYFDKKELDAIYLNFSDPWPKKRHAKRRLTHTSKVKVYHSLLNDEGCLIMKTDNRSLFEYSLVSVASHGFQLDEVFLDFRNTSQDDPITEYEQKFMDKGQPIYRAIWRKTNVK